MVTKNKSLVQSKKTALTASFGSAVLDQYMAKAYHLPVLSAAEEHALAVRYHEHNDIEAAHKLVMHNLRFVIQVARGYSGYGLPLNDLVQEGSIGLMKAVKKFNPAVGVRLISFAVYWIRAEIHEFVLQNWRIVKVATTKAQRKLFFKLRSKKKRLAWLNHKEVKEVAAQLDVKPEEVTEMESRLSGQDIGLDLSPENDEEGTYAAPSAFLPSNEPTPEQKLEEADWNDYRHNQFDQALKKLDQRSLEIIQTRWLSGEKTTLQDLGKKYNISTERVRQLESNAIKKMRGVISHSK